LKQVLFSVNETKYAKYAKYEIHIQNKSKTANGLKM